MKLVVLLALVLWQSTQPAAGPTTRPLTVQPALDMPATRPAGRQYVLHIPGVGGLMNIDRLLTRGLREGGIIGQIDIYNWTDGNPGMPALGNYARNQEQAALVARMIEQRARANPDQPITITGHSAGSGIAVWALERLPDDVTIDVLVMIQPALSPQYDLSRALRRVRRAYAFTSGYDNILGAGTRMFGTIDRVRTDAAGKVGFQMPPGADPEQYAKLREFPYDPAWMRFGNIGDHIGPMMRPFARRVIAPLLIDGELPSVTTRPAR